MSTLYFLVTRIWYLWMKLGEKFLHGYFSLKTKTSPSLFQPSRKKHVIWLEEKKKVLCCLLFFFKLFLASLPELKIISPMSMLLILCFLQQVYLKYIAVTSKWSHSQITHLHHWCNTAQWLLLREPVIQGSVHWRRIFQLQIVSSCSFRCVC